MWMYVIDIYNMGDVDDYDLLRDKINKIRVNLIKIIVVDIQKFNIAGLPVLEDTRTSNREPIRLHLEAYKV